MGEEEGSREGFDFSQLENRAPFMQAGVDIYKISLDDELFNKWMARSQMSKIFHNIPYWINSGGAKMFYDTVYVLSKFMNLYKTKEYVDKCRKIYDWITENTTTDSIDQNDYINCANQLLDEIIDLMRRLGWVVTTREVTANITSDVREPVRLIDEEYKRIREAAIREEETEAQAYGFVKPKSEELSPEEINQKIEEIEKENVPKYNPEDVKKNLGELDTDEIETEIEGD